MVSTGLELDAPHEEKESSAGSTQAAQNGDSSALLNRTKLLRDTLELLLDKSEEQKNVCEQLAQDNQCLQDYVENLMCSGNVLDK